MSGRRFHRAAVIVPAHNERTLIAECLRAVGIAAARAPIPVDVVVVADACSDGTQEAAENSAAVLPGHLVVKSVDLRTVGGARASGVHAALERASPHTLWIATTDADTVVPPQWLNNQLAHAEQGADLVLGTVLARNWDGWSEAVTAEYQRRYSSKVDATGHRHVHGANLGVAASSYLAVGGFPCLRAHEDLAFVQAIRAAGGHIVTALDIPVSTSTRRIARAPSGFADHLCSLATELDRIQPAPRAMWRHRACRDDRVCASSERCR